MTSQRGFWDDRDLTLQERFERFDQRNPQVFNALVDLVQRWARAGMRRWSVDAAFHVLRFERHIAGLPDEAELFKLNNSYTSRYARKLLDAYPQYADLIETRVLKT